MMQPEAQLDRPTTSQTMYVRYGQRLRSFQENYELRSQLAKIRRQTIGLRRYIAPQRDVMARLQNEPLKWFSDKARLHVMS